MICTAEQMNGQDNPEPRKRLGEAGIGGHMDEDEEEEEADGGNAAIEVAVSPVPEQPASAAASEEPEALGPASPSRWKRCTSIASSWVFQVVFDSLSHRSTCTPPIGICSL